MLWCCLALHVQQSEGTATACSSRDSWHILGTLPGDACQPFPQGPANLDKKSSDHTEQQRDLAQGLQGLDDGSAENRHFRSALTSDMMRACNVTVLQTSRTVGLCPATTPLPPGLAPEVSCSSEDSRWPCHPSSPSLVKSPQLAALMPGRVCSSGEYPRMCRHPSTASLACLGCTDSQSYLHGSSRGGMRQGVLVCLMTALCVGHVILSCCWPGFDAEDEFLSRPCLLTMRAALQTEVEQWLDKIGAHVPVSNSANFKAALQVRCSVRLHDCLTSLLETPLSVWAMDAQALRPMLRYSQLRL